MCVHGILQTVEEDPKYWDVLSAALAVGWLDIVVCVVCKLFTIVVNIFSEFKLDIKYGLRGTWGTCIKCWCLWLQVKLLRLHSSYQHNQLASREVSRQ